MENVAAETTWIVQCIHIGTFWATFLQKASNNHYEEQWFTTFDVTNSVMGQKWLLTVFSFPQWLHRLFSKAAAHSTICAISTIQRPAGLFRNVINHSFFFFVEFEFTESVEGECILCLRFWFPIHWRCNTWHYKGASIQIIVCHIVECWIPCIHRFKHV